MSFLLNDVYKCTRHSDYMFWYICKAVVLISEQKHRVVAVLKFILWQVLSYLASYFFYNAFYCSFILLGVGWKCFNSYVLGILYTFIKILEICTDISEIVEEMFNIQIDAIAWQKWEKLKTICTVPGSVQLFMPVNAWYWTGSEHAPMICSSYMQAAWK